MPAAQVDKKTAFWNAYNGVADEYDKEYQQKYGTDLDTCLIFVGILHLGIYQLTFPQSGLFSAVSSAFIIQIQPEIQPQGTHSLIIAAGCLLYISLACTLLGALLAVLGKQWLMYYAAAGERGTIEARGLDHLSPSPSVCTPPICPGSLSILYHFDRLFIGCHASP
ncbi:hypothetical protein C8R46DRAFT_1117588 [Mycena filopes]|nr:hypothetical protein C8R46DRAFT_1117588 [Mycena filopes]